MIKNKLRAGMLGALITLGIVRAQAQAAIVELSTFRDSTRTLANGTLTYRMGVTPNMSGGKVEYPGVGFVQLSDLQHVTQFQPIEKDHAGWAKP